MQLNNEATHRNSRTYVIEDAELQDGPQVSTNVLKRYKEQKWKGTAKNNRVAKRKNKTTKGQDAK